MQLVKANKFRAFNFTSENARDFAYAFFMIMAELKDTPPCQCCVYSPSDSKKDCIYKDKGQGTHNFFINYCHKGVLKYAVKSRNDVSWTKWKEYMEGGEFYGLVSGRQENS